MSVETHACPGCGREIPFQEEIAPEIFVPRAWCDDCAADLLAAEDDAARRSVLADALLDAGATLRLSPLSLDTHPDTQAVETASRWLRAYHAGRSVNLYLSGPVGTRKTGLAWGIIRALIEDAVERHFDADPDERMEHPRRVAMFVVWRDLYTDLVASFDRERRTGEVSPSDILARAYRVPVLALDDLGAGREPTAYALEQLESLIDRRYQAMKPTIITSNFTTRELTDRLGHVDEVAARRIVTRIVEGSVNHTFTGDSVRRPGKRL